ncbi:hypothetical protein Q4575_18250 [Psychrosphaera sp. 1_MG-2023]|uniref:hypothetical protein n=1 Tax=Psychrosphaera sp. 1_MG-2023 TaxID=3062643 RepID=UPI0026E41337|nr:hypothetical protein [Psychrosphaera sp. 1_MG-2023]MDO6721357.1 hypothetical protein [Psychrosphaera sp. 1_MG-2023]
MSSNKQMLSVKTCIAGLLISTVSMFSFADQTVKVEINVSDVIGQQNPLYYGGNNIYPKGGQGILKANGEFDPVEMNAAKKLGLQSYRFPGGSEANLYKWKRAIGPVSQRIDNVSGNNQSNRSNEFGPDEFGRLLETTSFTHGVIMVAWGYETPEDAADWVEYMNAKVGENPNGGKDWAAERAKNGHVEPYGIKYWEIGNEVFGNWELNWGSYPTELDGKRGNANVEKDDAKGTNGMLAFGDADRYVFGGYKYFKSQKAAAQTSWKDSHIKTTTAANQKLYVKFAPVSLHDPKQPFNLRIDGTLWQRVSSFEQSGAKDKHYVLDTKIGEITFGDGVNGMIPPSNEFVKLDYLTGKQPGFIDYYHKMKAVDPSIQIISSFEKKSFFKHMAKAKQPFDGIAKHYYPGDLKQAHKNYTQAIYAGLGIGHKIEEIKEWNANYDNPSLTGKEQIWLTEYGLKNHINQLAIMHTVINEYSDDVAALMGHSLFLNNNTPMVNDDGVIRSRAFPIEIFAKHMQQQFVKVEVSGAQNKFRRKKIPAILATASVSPDQKHVGVVLTNTSDRKRTVAKITMDGFKTETPMKAEVWALMSTVGNPLIDNSKSNPNAITLEPLGAMKRANTDFDITVEPGATFIIKWSPQTE